jgi:LacI family gluconate utilization system Gnt-I transcriptional repressor
VLIEAQIRGLHVPRQLAVIGLGDIGFAASVEPALTTVRIDGTRIGQTAAQYIVDRAEGRTIAEPILDIGFSIVERKSA